ncbi:hypothetical protein PVL29_011808 [Vitis rotundifolia]|uniref:Uncharacterized protein n=1 Tax=Vitis rotundifolia TaxID=103349 RepID=A0AA38ZQ18_VITRO|nr:hypothetical protein PVL29_011808 [Vitis rotundifolia]
MVRGDQASVGDIHKRIWEGKRNQPSEDNNARFPFLTIWMPPLKKRTEEVEGKERKPNSSVSKPGEEPNLNFQLVPVKLPEVSDDGPSAK